MSEFAEIPELLLKSLKVVGSSTTLEKVVENPTVVADMILTQKPDIVDYHDYDEDVENSATLPTTREDDIEKSASDSGYESDRRKSFSSSNTTEHVGDCGESSEFSASSSKNMPAAVAIENIGAAQDIKSLAVEASPTIIPLNVTPVVVPVIPQLLLPSVLPLLPHPAMHLKQVESAIMERPNELAWDPYSRIRPIQRTQPQDIYNGAKIAPPLPPVVLPLPVCCKASPFGPKEARKYAIPKYAVGFVIGHHGSRIQATRDVSGATILMLGDKDVHHAIIGVFGTLDQIRDAVFLMKQNILRYSGMFIGDLNGMLKQIAE